MSGGEATSTPEAQCPLCHHTIEGKTPQRQRPDSLASIIVTAQEDVKVWAEGDVVADDGHLLHVQDLTRHLAEELAPVLMKMYMAELRRHKREQAALRRRVQEEQVIVDAVVAGKKPPSIQGNRGRKFCKREHPRTPDNVSANGACLRCNAFRQQQARSAGK